MRKALVFIALAGLLAFGGPMAPVRAAVGTVTDSDDVPNNAGDISAASVVFQDTVTVTVTVLTPQDPHTSDNWKRADADTFVSWFLDTNAVAGEDFEVDFSANPDGTLAGEVINLATDTSACSGTALFEGGSYKVTFPRTCIGSPSSLKFNVFVSYDATPGVDDVPQADEAPDSGAFSDAVAYSAGSSSGSDRPVRVGAVGQSDNQLWVGNGFGAFYTPYGGQLLAAPALARIAQADANADATPFFVATGTDHHLWGRRGNLEPWRPLSDVAYCNDSPGAVVYDADPGAGLDQRVVVACQGSDNALWSSTAPISPSSTPKLNAWTRIGGILTAGPGVSVAQGVVTYLVPGVNGRVYQSLGTGFSPTNWTCKGHPAFGTLNATAWFGCHGTDDALWVAKNGGTGWGNAFSLGGRLVDGPGVAVTANQAVFFVQGTDSQVWQRVVQNSDGAPVSNFTPDGGRVKFGVNATSL
jgi:hypothetical protein